MNVRPGFLMALLIAVCVFTALTLALNLSPSDFSRAVRAPVDVSVPAVRVERPAGPPAPAAPPQTLAELSGNGIRSSQPFTAPGPWEIQWEFTGDLIQIYVNTGDGELAGLAVSQEGPGPGKSYQPRGGRYYFDVSAIGSWTVRAVTVP